jgi:tetratricopeptide (TPR) repeat protein
MPKILVLLPILLPAFLCAQTLTSDFADRYAVAIEAGQIQHAIQIAEEWTKNENREATPYFLLAEALIRKGRKYEATKNLKMALTIDSLHIPSLLTYAEISKSESLTYYEKLIAINPSNSYFYRKAAENAVESQKFDKASAYYNLAYGLDSLDLITINGFARLLIDFRQKADADTLLDRALKIDPQNDFARLTKAKIAFESENWEEVLEWVRPYFEEPMPPLTVMRYAGISLYQIGKYEESIEWLRRLSNKVGELDYPHYYMGLCMEKLGQTEMAAVQFGQAVNKALSGNLGVYYERLGVAEQATGNHEEAIEAFKMAKSFSAGNILNFHLAKSYDAFYQDSKPAMELFQEFIEREVNENSDQAEEIRYAKSRINQIRKNRHFDIPE